MAGVMASENTTAATNNITIQEAGDYAITYAITFTPSAQIANLEFSVRNNETDLAPSTITATDVTAPTTYNGTFITNLENGAVIDMALTDAAATGTVTINNANLSVQKLNASTPAA